MAPSTTKQWTVNGKNGFDSLSYNEKAEIPQLGDHDVLVNFHYASLNYRDLVIPKVALKSHQIASPLAIAHPSSIGQIWLPN